eukprot:m.113967 g.113967  ORF g.113967 m.113967 type:complete len:74 (+) comp21500_c0_seq1:2071-2292(+)
MVKTSNRIKIGMILFLIDGGPKQAKEKPRSRIIVDITIPNEGAGKKERKRDITVKRISHMANDITWVVHTEHR